MSNPEAHTNSCPACIVHVPAGNLKIAGLTLLDRLIVTLHRAGATPVYVLADGPLPPLKRSTALRIPVQVCSQPPALNRLALIASSDIVTHPADVRKLLSHHATLVTRDAQPLPIGFLDHPNPDWEKALGAKSRLKAHHFAARITDEPSRAAAERKLWSSLNSSADGLVDKFLNRPAGRPLSKLLAHTGIGPNAVSLAAILIGLVAAWCFALGSSSAIIFGAFLFQLSAIVDCVDGDLARVLFKESRLGKWLDLAGDQVVHVSVFAGIALGLVRQGYPLAFWLGLSAVLGAILSFLVVLQSLRQSAAVQSNLLKKLINSLTNRDFSLLVLALACMHRLEWFLWLSAIGSHVFWILGAGLQFHASSAEKLKP